MLFVWVRITLQEVSKHVAVIKELIDNLPGIVAEALSVPGTDGELTSDEIEVKFETFGPFDVHSKDIEIIILANDYPERKKNLDERQTLIKEGVKRILYSGITGFVWVLPLPGSFGEF
ncbi:hypothetical protein KJA15_01260 [Patescibacteria group bacterium]|nr:hypothetical protein [Patescibacteria group bacterium]